MNTANALLLIFLLAAGCLGERSHRDHVQGTGSDKGLSTHKALESAIRQYYRSVEQEVKMDLGVSEAAVTERVQLLIDEGYVKKPVILILTEEGPRWKTVDYATYKELMTDHAIASRKFHGIQPNIIDSISVDSIRVNLLEALREDSLP